MVDSGDHFALENWTDFVRGYAAADLATEMHGHLEAGCPSCSRSATLWRRVVECALRERRFHPPDRNMRWARALYSSFIPQRGQTWTLRIARMLGQVQPAPAGVRGLAPASSHYLFQEGDVLLDLQLENTPVRGPVSMVGQLFDSARPEQRYQGRSVSLRHDEKVVTNSTTDQFGEFQLQFRPQEDLLLVIELDRESYLVSSLPPVTEA